MVYAMVERALFYPNAAGRVRLRVHVNQQCRNIGGRKTGGEIDSRSRLSNPTFLIGDCNDFSHMSISRRDKMKLRQRRANYHIRNSSESKWGCSTWNGRGKRRGENFSQSPRRPQSVSRGTDDVNYISLIRARNE